MLIKTDNLLKIIRLLIYRSRCLIPSSTITRIVFYLKSLSKLVLINTSISSRFISGTQSHLCWITPRFICTPFNKQESSAITKIYIVINNNNWHLQLLFITYKRMCCLIGVQQRYPMLISQNRRLFLLLLWLCVWLLSLWLLVGWKSSDFYKLLWTVLINELKVFFIGFVNK